MVCWSSVRDTSFDNLVYNILLQVFSRFMQCLYPKSQLLLTAALCSICCPFKCTYLRLPNSHIQIFSDEGMVVHVIIIISSFTLIKFMYGNVNSFIKFICFLYRFVMSFILLAIGQNINYVYFRRLRINDWRPPCFTFASIPQFFSPYSE